MKTLAKAISILVVVALLSVLVVSVCYADQGGIPNENSNKPEKPPKEKKHNQSDPDDDGKGPDRSNGGPDKPPDGEDWNNGSGNDIDCEDDNEGVGVPGHCKKKPPEGPVIPTEVITETVTIVEEWCARTFHLVRYVDVLEMYETGDVPGIDKEMGDWQEGQDPIVTLACGQRVTFYRYVNAEWHKLGNLHVEHVSPQVELSFTPLRDQGGNGWVFSAHVRPAGAAKPR